MRGNRVKGSKTPPNGDFLKKAATIAKGSRTVGTGGWARSPARAG